jgi:hypothetical protein
MGMEHPSTLASVKAADPKSAEIARRDLLAKEKGEGPQTEQPITRLSLPMRKILAYLPHLQRPPRLEESGSTKRTRGRIMDL